MKVENARRTPPRNDSVEGCANRNPVSPSTIVSARPPVRWPIGSEPKRWAYIWLSPQGSKRDGIRVKSLPAKIFRASSVVEADDFTAIGVRRRAHLRLQQRLLEPAFALARHDNLAARIDDHFSALSIARGRRPSGAPGAPRARTGDLLRPPVRTGSSQHHLRRSMTVRPSHRRRTAGTARSRCSGPSSRRIPFKMPES